MTIDVGRVRGCTGIPNSAPMTMRAHRHDATNSSNAIATYLLRAYEPNVKTRLRYAAKAVYAMNPTPAASSIESNWKKTTRKGGRLLP
jgi:hypothetical protein